MRSQKKATVGVANELPYSSLTPSGSITGLGPSIVKTVLSELGVHKVVGKVATYGELIPGLDAKRWQLIGATMTITAARCKAVDFSYPMTVGTDAFAYMKSSSPPPTFAKAIALAKKGSLKIGVAGSGANYGLVVAAGVTPEVFPTVVAADQGMEAGRVGVVFDDRAGLVSAEKTFQSRIKVGPSLPDIPASFSSVALPKGHPHFVQQFDAAVKQLKTSGKFNKVLAKYGFSIPTKYQNITGAQVCNQLKTAGNS